MSRPPPPPPPRHLSRKPQSHAASLPASLPHSSSSSSTGGEKEKKGWKSKGAGWGNAAMKKGFHWSDAIGGKVNGVAGKMGSEAFWPVTGDFPQQMDKAARILRAFTVDGLETTIPVDKSKDPLHGKKQRKVLRKIPPAVIQEAKGLAIFTSMRSGIAPLGGAGGAGVVVSKLDDGTWSAPSAMSPNNLSTGLMIGVDIYDAVLIIRTQKALESFFSHKATLGTDIGVVAGPFGAGAAIEAGKEKAPVFSYVKSRGLFAGVQLVGQVFVDRYEENGAMYSWPGIKAGDILQGKVRVPYEAKNLMEALNDAESGRAQTMKGNNLDEFVEVPLHLKLRAGEVLKLPPTPTSIDNDENDYGVEAQRVIPEHTHSLDPFAGPASGHGYIEMDRVEAREWEQHDETLQQMIKEEQLEKSQSEEHDMRLYVEDEDLSQAAQRLSVGSKEESHYTRALEEEEYEEEKGREEEEKGGNEEDLSYTTQLPIHGHEGGP